MKGHDKQVVWTATMLLGMLALPAWSPAQYKAAEPGPYLLKTCLVSGDKLGGMGAPYAFVHDGREIKLCCKGCLKAFNKQPATYIKKLEEAEKSPRGKNTGEVKPGLEKQSNQ